MLKTTDFTLLIPSLISSNSTKPFISLLIFLIENIFGSLSFLLSIKCSFPKSEKIYPVKPKVTPNINLIFFSLHFLLIFTNFSFFIISVITTILYSYIISSISSIELYCDRHSTFTYLFNSINFLIIEESLLFIPISFSSK